MVQKRTAIAGLILGLAILIFGLALIVSKDWVWSLFGLLYGVLGIQAKRRRLWEMFITTIGLGVVATGLYLFWSMLRSWRNSR